MLNLNFEKIEQICHLANQVRAFFGKNKETVEKQAAIATKAISPLESDHPNMRVEQWTASNWLWLKSTCQYCLGIRMNIEDSGRVTQCDACDDGSFYATEISRIS